jgi:hypothetical protein
MPHKPYARVPPTAAAGRPSGPARATDDRRKCASHISGKGKVARTRTRTGAARRSVYARVCSDGAGGRRGGQVRVCAGGGGTTDLGEPAGVCECAAVRRCSRCITRQPHRAMRSIRAATCNMNCNNGVAQRAAIIATCNDTTQRMSFAMCNPPREGCNRNICSVRPVLCNTDTLQDKMQPTACNLQPAAKL